MLYDPYQCKTYYHLMAEKSADKLTYNSQQGANDMMASAEDKFAATTRQLLIRTMNLMAMTICFAAFWPLVVSLLPAQIISLNQLLGLFPAAAPYFHQWITLFAISSAVAMAMQLML